MPSVGLFTIPFFSSVQSLSCVRLFANPWTAACQASLSITNSQSLPKLMSIESVMHPTISSSVDPFSSCPQPFPPPGSFQMSQLFALGGQSVGVSASSVLPMQGTDAHLLVSNLSTKVHTLCSVQRAVGSVPCDGLAPTVPS